MKYFFIILVVSIAFFTSCDGKERAYKNNNEKINDSNLSQSYFEQVTYIPENSFKQEVDTILGNGFHVKIKTYTDLNNNVTFTKTQDTFKNIDHYRNFKFDLFVEKEGKIIYNESFDKEKANKLLGYKNDFPEESPYHNFNDLAVLKSIEVDDEPKLKDKVLIDIVYAIPESNRYAVHTLFINEDGITNVVHVEIN